MKAHYDIAIVGGGMVGASLACALANQPLSVVLIEAVPFKSGSQPSYDDRGLALSLSTRRVLESFKVWAELDDKATPIEHVHVSDRGHFGFVRLHAADLAFEALGYVVIARELGRALVKRIQAAGNIDILCPTSVSDLDIGAGSATLTLDDAGRTQNLTCKLVVVADGAQSVIRERLGIPVTIMDYHQTAIVSNISVAREHNNTAYERFTSSGPLALLPLSEKRMVSVQVVADQRLQDYLQYDDRSYMENIERQFGKRLGRIKQVGKRSCYPIRRTLAQNQFDERVLLLGNAAHAIHPNGAQGFNLSLRDVAALAEILLEGAESGLDPGDPGLLQDYYQARVDDQNRVIRFTDRVADAFYSDNPLKIAGRNLTLLLMDTVPAIKYRFMRETMGIAGRQPAAVHSRTV